MTLSLLLLLDLVEQFEVLSGCCLNSLSINSLRIDSLRLSDLGLDVRIDLVKQIVEVLIVSKVIDLCKLTKSILDTINARTVQHTLLWIPRVEQGFLLLTPDGSPVKVPELDEVLLSILYVGIVEFEQSMHLLLSLLEQAKSTFLISFIVVLTLDDLLLLHIISHVF